LTRRGVIALVALVTAGSAAGGYTVRRWWMSSAADASDKRIRADAIFAARFANLSGGTEALEQWRGRVLVVNFWATWCAPCREEIPLFIQMQKHYGARGLQFVGVAIDQREPVAAFQREFGMNYPVLLGGLEAMELMRSTGNRMGVLPYTLVIDRAGRVASSKLGGLKEDQLERLILRLL
jgi:thiol-disulfide isomerase/thioredoxin